MGAKILCAGDAPWLMRLISRLGSELSSLSSLPLYIQDPEPAAVKAAEEKLIPKGLKGAERTKFNVRKQLPGEWKAAMESLGAILPNTVHTDGYRTRLPIPLIDELPDVSLIYMESNLCALPDATHLVTRSAENDVIEHFQRLIRAGKTPEMNRLQNNIDQRVAKHFKYEEKKDQKTICPISFGGRDARAVYADTDQLKKYIPGVCDIFTGVYYDNVYVPAPKDNQQQKVLLELHPYLADHTNSLNNISELALAQLQFKSMNDAVQILRTKNGLAENLQAYKKSVEAYYQSTLLLAGLDGLTPYKLKLDMIWRVCEKGYVTDPWNHLTESGEKSHHTSHKEYHAKTMRDGGHDTRNMNSEYSDLRFTFWRIVSLSTKRINTVFKKQLALYARQFKLETLSKTPSYLNIVQRPVGVPRLDIGKEHQFFRGMRFTFLGSFTLGNKGDVEQVVKEHGGLPINPAGVKNMSRYAYLPQCYCVLKDDEQIKTFIKGKGTLVFTATTRGDWKYLKFKFITDCIKENKLLNPSLYLFEIKEEDKKLFQKQTTQEVSHQLQRQINLNIPGATNTLTASTALRKHMQERKAKEKKRQARRNNTVISMSAERKKYENFVKCLVKERNFQKTISRKQRFQEINQLRSRASRQWRTKSYLEKLTYSNV